MTIDAELEAHILRFYHVEKWRCGTIARQLHVHRDTVKRVLAQAGLPHHGPAPRASMIEPYLSFISQTLEKYPTLTASRLYGMVRERGYQGGPTHFRHLISLHRPRPPAEAYLRLRTLPGEQMQCDWGLCRARHSPHYAEFPDMPSIRSVPRSSCRSTIETRHSLLSLKVLQEREQRIVRPVNR